VAGIFILRQRRVLPVELEALGSRLAWFDNYFECSLSLYARGLVAPDSVVEVARQTGLSMRGIGASFAAVAARPRWIMAPERSSARAAVSEPTKRAPQKRVATAVRRAQASSDAVSRTSPSDYVTLVTHGRTGVAGVVGDSRVIVVLTTTATGRTARVSRLIEGFGRLRAAVPISSTYVWDAAQRGKNISHRQGYLNGCGVDKRIHELSRTTFQV
jgi:hypothetical protein